MKNTEIYKEMMETSQKINESLSKIDWLKEIS